MLEELGARRRGIRKNKSKFAVNAVVCHPDPLPTDSAQLMAISFRNCSGSHHKGHAISTGPEERGETHVPQLLETTAWDTGGTAQKGPLSSLWDADTSLWLLLLLSTPRSLTPHRC